MPKYLFLTGTNTDVGKTFIGTKLIKDLNKKYNYLAFKPIETGCRKKGSKLIPADSRKYHSILSEVMTLNELNPFRFVPPISPYLAIKRGRKKIFIKDYIEKLKIISRDSPVLLEGAGGAFSPIALDGLNIDLMKMIKSINVLIIKDELGCISSAISNILAFEKYRVRLDLLVLNTQKKNDMDNLKEIKKYTDIPIVNYTKPSDIKTIQNKINKIL
jgi:dethiobiotin synthetase|tara:strand:+ start:144 stop:791 length:648 start_codon:yes stop_codon:yes gene_type:complete